MIPPVISSLEDYPHVTGDKVRYSDTDRQGHVNNAAFASYLETGRVEILYDPRHPLTGTGCAFVIARLELDYLGEITWPGEIRVGTRVEKLGRSSVTFGRGSSRMEDASPQPGLS